MKPYKIINSSRPFTKKVTIQPKLKQFKIPLRLFKAIHGVNSVCNLKNS